MMKGALKSTGDVVFFFLYPVYMLTYFHAPRLEKGGPERLSFLINVYISDTVS